MKNLFSNALFVTFVGCVLVISAWVVPPIIVSYSQFHLSAGDSVHILSDRDQHVAFTGSDARVASIKGSLALVRDDAGNEDWIPLRDLRER